MAGVATRILIGLACAAAVLPAGASPKDEPTPEVPEFVPGPSEDRVMPGIPADTPLLTEDPPGAPDRAQIPGEVPTVEYDPEKLPTPVRRLREQILEAAASGDIEKLRPIIDANGEPPAFSYNDIGDDPIAYLRSISADPEGREILAILVEMLESGYVHASAGTPNEMYVWPYFANYPVDKLTPPQIVELLEIVYPGDYEDMKIYGVYLFYRVGLKPDGTWHYFIAGE